MTLLRYSDCSSLQGLDRSLEFTQMMTMNRVRLLLLSGTLFLSGCSFAFDRPEPSSNPLPDSTQQKLIALQIIKTVEKMRDAKGAALSEVGLNRAQSGPEQWTQCARVDFPSRSLYYTFFVRGEKVVDSRSAVIMDGCEARDYRPVALGNSSSIY